MRMIDADAEFLVTVNYGGGLSECYRTTVAEYLGEYIDKIPTIDAVPVVRCGRCEYYSNEMNCCSYVNGLQNVTKTDYCSYGRCADGERRTE